MSDPMSSARVWSPEAEQSVLGCVLHGADAADLGLTAESFYEPRHRQIWRAVAALVAARRGVDPITVCAAMADAGQAQDDTLPYLTALVASVVSPRFARQHAALVRDKAARRQLAEAAAAAQETAWAHDSAQAALEAINTTFAAIESRGAGDAVSLRDVLSARLEHWQDLAEGRVQPGISTGWPSLDLMLGGGLQSGRVYVIAARPSVGKSSLAAHIAMQAARAGHGVFVASLEMQSAELVDRMTANTSGVSMVAFTTGRFDRDDWRAVAAAADALAALPIEVDDAAGLTIGDIRSRARAVQRRSGVAVLVIDHVQLVRSRDARGMSRHHQIEAISRDTKIMAKQLGVAVLLLSQLNREVERRNDAEPTLADLKESGAIEEDADAVLLLHPVARMPSGDVLVQCRVAKSRSGQRGRLPLLFDGARQRWRLGEVSLLTSARREPRERP